MMGFFYDQASSLLLQLYDSRIETPPILDHQCYFPAADQFAEAWPAIRQEALAVAANLQNVPRFHDIMSAQAEISANDGRDWRMFILKAYGVESAANMAACPTLAALVNATPDVLSASLSFMAPGKHIPAHRGPFRGILRFYLVLDMPKHADGRPAAVLKVAGQEYRLDEGDCLLWDDTYLHEAWNESEQVRTVLLLDVWRHGMSANMARLSKTLVALAGAGVRFGGIAKRL
jgi:aspartate beta-hydroxylase